MTNSIFAQLAAQCLPFIEAYHDDLLKHDRAAIGEETAPRTPFLHWTRPTGTHLLQFTPAEEYPPIGVQVPYLFASAGRDHILDQTVVIARYASTEAVRAVHYFDGRALREISASKAIELAEDYRRSVQRQWHLKEYRSTWAVPKGYRLIDRYGHRCLVAEGSAPV